MQRRSAQTGTGVDVPQRRVGECYCNSPHGWKYRSVDYHSRVVVRQCMRAESSTVDADGENIVPLYSLHMERECQLGINVNAEAHDTG